MSGLDPSDSAHDVACSTHTTTVSRAMSFEPESSKKDKSHRGTTCHTSVSFGSLLNPQALPLPSVSAGDGGDPDSSDDFSPPPMSEVRQKLAS